MRRETTYTSISPEVREAVWRRDRGRCVLCGSTKAGPWCHYIPRSRGGLGIEENIVTLCEYHHRILDQGHGSDRCTARQDIRAYLQALYPGWSETNLIYRKDNNYVSIIKGGSKC